MVNCFSLVTRWADKGENLPSTLMNLHFAKKTLDRPHTASAMMQSCFHGLLVRELLQGRIDKDRWARSTQEFSSILVNVGHQLGEVCMSQRVEDGPKTPEYFKVFMGTQKKLTNLWEENLDIV